MGIDTEGIRISIDMVFYILVSFAFFSGILLMVSPEAFRLFDKSLRQEYGVKKRIIPYVENKTVYAFDEFLIKHGVISGMFLSISAFVLLLIFR